jgi:dimeric dUTPase (all-alpha-NTP-PPase superfamily)
MIKINEINELVSKQKEIDLLIYRNANVQWEWESTYNSARIKLNILVEIGELCNEIKEFKILRRGTTNLHDAQEELIDCLSFFLGLVGIFDVSLSDINFAEFGQSKNYDNLNFLLLDFFAVTNNLTNDSSCLFNSYYNQWMLIFFKIAAKLNMDLQEVIKVYLMKNKKTYERLAREIGEKIR